jgi:hypothetical protein
MHVRYNIIEKRGPLKDESLAIGICLGFGSLDELPHDMVPCALQNSFTNKFYLTIPTAASYFVAGIESAAIQNLQHDNKLAQLLRGMWAIWQGDQPLE